jgi:hypothetical protein
MRSLLPLLILTLVGGGLVAVRVLADEPAAPTPAPAPEPVAVDVGALLQRVITLETRVAYLQSREKALTAYALASDQRAKDLAEALRQSRLQGFTMGAVSSTSRETLLHALEAYSIAVRKDLPQPTQQEKDLLKSAATGR